MFCLQTHKQKLFNKMGNSSVNRSNLLARNWIRVNNLTYRNVTTNELIDEYRIQYRTEEQVVVGSGQLMKRANINHPNIIKLIYFCQDNAKSSCRGSIYSHRLYIEHYQFNLRDLIKANLAVKRKEQCLCCPTINGLFFLAQKYGFFLVKEQMILVNEREWHNSSRKRSAKVWVNSELNRSECESVCSEQQMCQKISIIYKSMLEHHLCGNPRIKEIGQFRRLQEQLNFLFQVHQLNPQLIKHFPSAVIKSSHQPEPIGAYRHQQSQQPLQRATNRSFSTYVKEEALPRRDNSIVAQSTSIYTSNKKMVPTTSDMIFRNLSRSPSPSVKISFLFANSSAQQNSNFQKGKTIIPPEVTRPQSSLPLNLTNINFHNYDNTATEKEAVLKVKQNIQNIIEIKTSDKESEKEDQLKKDLQEIAQSQKSIPQQSHSSTLGKPSQKQPSLAQESIQAQYSPQIAAMAEQQLIGKDSIAANSKSVLQESKALYEQVPLINQENLKYAKNDNIYNIYKQEHNLVDQPKKNSTISKTYSSKFQKADINREEPNHNDNINKFNSFSHHCNDKEESDSCDRQDLRLSDQDNFMIHQQYESLTNKMGKQVQSGKLLESVPQSSQRSQYIQQELADIMDDKEMRQNRRKLQKIQLEKDLQHEKDIIKKEMAMLLKSNMMSDETHRIKQKVNNKKATFAQLKAEASKILDGFGF